MDKSAFKLRIQNVCGSIKPTLDVIHSYQEPAVILLCVCARVCDPPACALLSREHNTPFPGMSRHSQGKHSRFNYKLQRGLVCVACACVFLCTSVCICERGVDKKGGRKGERTYPFTHRCTRRAALTWAAWGTAGPCRRSVAPGETLWVPSVKKKKR